MRKTVEDADIRVRSTSMDGQIIPGNIPVRFTDITPDEDTGQVSRGTTDTTDYEQKELGELINRARGNRTVSQFAAQAGVSRSTVSDLIHCRMPSKPTKRTLMKLFHKNAEPAAGTLQEALRLAHYAPYERQNGTENSKASVIKPLQMLLELLIETAQISLQFQVDMGPNGRTAIVDSATRRKFIGLPAFRNETMSAAETELILKAMLLDEVFSEDAEKGEATYMILVDDEEVYGRAAQLPLLQCRAMYVVLTDQEHNRFYRGLEIRRAGETAQWVPGDPL